MLRSLEFYWNTRKDMLLHENLKTGKVTRFEELPRSFFLEMDSKISRELPEQHNELCDIVGCEGCEYGRVYQFCACNFATKDGTPDIDDDGNFVFEKISCPIRHVCQRITCKPKATGNISEREKQVIRLMVKGHTEEEIGERLFISKSTVHNHFTNIYQKLGLTGKNNPDRLLVAYAIRKKI